MCLALLLLASVLQYLQQAKVRRAMLINVWDAVEVKDLQVFDDEANLVCLWVNFSLTILASHVIFF